MRGKIINNRVHFESNSDYPV